MTQDTREKVRLTYAKGGRQYDQVRLQDPRGRLLSDHDVRLFLEMLPECDAQSGALWAVLEVGAGTGRFTMPALSRGFRLTATDINETMLEQLKVKIAEAECDDCCEARIEDIFNLSFPDASFDFVFSLHVIPRFVTHEDRRAAILEVARTMKPGARFLFNYRNRNSTIYRRLHRGHASTPEQIESILKEAGLRIVHQRGKWLLTRGLLNRLPLFAGRLAARIDWCLLDFRPWRAWDVFVVAVKDAHGSRGS